MKEIKYFLPTNIFNKEGVERVERAGDVDPWASVRSRLYQQVASPTAINVRVKPIK